MEDHANREHSGEVHALVPCSHGCGKTYVDERHMLRHLPVHAGTRYRCNFCDMVLATVERLKEHQSRASHPHDPDDLRDISDEPGVQLSRRPPTTTPGVHPCLGCSWGFGNSGALRRHEKKHENTLFLCNHCDDLFEVVRNLLSHQEIHGCPSHPSDLIDISGQTTRIPTFLAKRRPQDANGHYPCLREGCGRSYRHWTSLMKHEDVHIGKRVECGCGETFSDVGYLSCHIKKAANPACMQAERDLKCGCGRAFKYWHLFRAHECRTSAELPAKYVTRTVILNPPWPDLNLDIHWSPDPSTEKSSIN
ncbi:unnamed protein product [Rhizoctonia solani]|uniref:C2H2-type domain-containing protein n=1 Tax=Rhizoctonia solani TaxID=456999 RepID=A0A8H3CNA2_9AGAM|nr:unnamed protein product [Rhizoctonia solani]CAE6515113.1 unnamed protein product [Rhizoctonia solani]